MKNFVLLSLVLLAGTLFAQKERPNSIKDDPQARYEFDLMRLKNPRTNKIPNNIRFKELEFAKTLKSNQRVSSELTWVNRGPYNVGGRTRALAVDVRNENIILAGGVSGGVWKSTNQGSSWTKTTSPGDLQSVTAIAQDTRSGHEDTWYYATGEYRGNSASAASGSDAYFTGDGVFKSTDNGETWQQLAATSDEDPTNFDAFALNHEIAVNPANGDIYLANWGGIYRSQNGGTSWGEVMDIGGGAWADVVISSSGIIYVALDAEGVFRSTTGNSGSWTEISSGTSISNALGDRKELAIAPSNENIIYMIGESTSGTSGHQLWKFDESTDTWTDRTSNIPALGGLTGNFTSQGSYDLLIKVKPDDPDFVVIGGTNLFKSTDGFATSINSPSTNNPNWIGGYTASNGSYALYLNHHPDQHAFVFLSGDKALSGNDGGVQLTNDVTASSVSWIWKNNGYLTTQSYAISVGPGNQIMSGFQDNSTWLTVSSSPTATWTDEYGGDGAYNAFNSDGTIRYMSSQNANIDRVTYSSANSDIATGFFAFTPSSGYSTSLFITPFYLDPTDDDLFYLGGASNLFVNTQASTGNANTGWKSISLGGSGIVSEIGVTNFDQVLAGTSGGDLFRITNPGGSSNVTEITGSNFPSAYISGISVNQFNPQEILVCFSPYGVQSVFHTNNGGTTWTHVGGNIEENEDGSGVGPSARITAIVGNGDKYFVGTSTGLYSTEEINGSSTVWTLEDSNGIGNAVVEHIAKRDDGFVAVGTHANGIYSSSVTVTSPEGIDLSVTGISPSLGAFQTENIVATVFNGGSSAVSSFDISLYVDDSFVVTETANLNIDPLETSEYTFSQGYDFSTVGTYDVRVEVSIDGDSNSDNDSFESVLETIASVNVFPYTESFEGSHDWTSSGSWQLGTPSSPQISGASDGTKAWATILSGDHPNDDYALLESPVFILDGLVNPVLSFDLNYDINDTFNGNFYDALVFGYRTEIGGNYQVLFDDNDSFKNWYTANSVVFGHDAWVESTDGSYVEVEVPLGGLGDISTIQFVFAFASDETVTNDGAAVDNFSISSAGAPPTDIGLTASEIQENEPVGTQIGLLSNDRS